VILQIFPAGGDQWHSVRSAAWADRLSVFAPDARIAPGDGSTTSSAMRYAPMVRYTLEREPNRTAAMAVGMRLIAYNNRISRASSSRTARLAARPASGRAPPLAGRCRCSRAGWALIDPWVWTGVGPYPIYYRGISLCQTLMVRFSQEGHEPRASTSPFVLTESDCGEQHIELHDWPPNGVEGNQSSLGRSPRLPTHGPADAAFPTTP
jgi:hypothetical protein